MSAGRKFDSGKPPISLIPVEAILEEAMVFHDGGIKYGKHNFKEGLDYTRIIDAALRHLLAIAGGEDKDPETGRPHWAHVRANMAMLAYYETHNKGKDDRYKEKTLGQNLVKSLEQAIDMEKRIKSGAV